MRTAKKRSSYSALIGVVDEDGENGVDSQDYMLTASSGQTNAEAKTRRRIQTDRIKALVALGAVLVLAFSAAMLGVGLEQYKQTSVYKGRGVVVLSLSRTMAALMEEAAHAVMFTDPDMSIEAGDDGLTDRDRAERLTVLQKATRDAFEVAVGQRQAFCASCESILSMYNFAELLTIQKKTLLRVIGPVEVYEYYAAGMRRLLSVMASFTGWGIEHGVASSVWTEQLLLASRGLAFAGASWQDAYAANSLQERKSFTFMATSTDALDLITAYSPVMVTHEPNADDVSQSAKEIQAALGPTVEGVDRVMRSAVADFTGLQSEGVETAQTIVADTLDAYRHIIATVEAEDPWGKVTLREWQWVIGLSAALLVLSAVVVVMAVREATALVWAADAELAQMKATHRLETSLVRMHRFLDTMFSLDRVGMAAAVEVNNFHGASATSAERELMQLVAPARHVLSFVNPCILDRCLASYEAHGTAAQLLNDAQATAPGDPVVMGLGLQYVSLAMVDLRCFAHTDITIETARTLPKELLVFLNDISALAAQCGGTILSISGTVLTIAWNVRTNGGSRRGDGDGSSGSSGGGGANGNPSSSGTAFGQSMGVVSASTGDPTRRRRRGVGASSLFQRALATGANSDGGTDTPENDACQMLLRFRLTKLQHKYPKVRFAVVSGVCKQGVVGSRTTRAYVVTGNLVMLGRVLLEGARFHDVSSVTDTATFLKLDTLQFRKRALEVMGIHPESDDESLGVDENGAGSTGLAMLSSPRASMRTDGNYSHLSSGNKTVVYELTITGVETNEYALLWNAAFDDFFTNRLDDAMRKLMAWRRLFGERPTFTRTMNVLCETGGYRGPAYFRSPDINGFEYNFVV